MANDTETPPGVNANRDKVVIIASSVTALNVSQHTQCGKNCLIIHDAAGLAYLMRCDAIPMHNATKKILIIDSNDSFRELLKTFMKGLGHEVYEGTTGPDAIEKASSIHPDLIMMDVRLPGMNGDEVTAQLKRSSATRNIPVILSTGWTTACNVEAKIERALMAGANEVLYRPLQFPLLRNVMRSYLFT
jgi:CheY-like chemotaxis protein